jgi:hypothetical protein
VLARSWLASASVRRKRRVRGSAEPRAGTQRRHELGTARRLGGFRVTLANPCRRGPVAFATLSKLGHAQSKGSLHNGGIDIPQRLWSRRARPRARIKSSSQDGLRQGLRCSDVFLRARRTARCRPGASQVEYGAVAISSGRRHALQHAPHRRRCLRAHCTEHRPRFPDRLMPVIHRRLSSEFPCQLRA